MKLINLETIGEPETHGRFYPTFLSIPLNVSYDADAYRSFVQRVRDVGNSVEKLPFHIRGEVGKMLEQAVRATIDAQRVLYDSLIDAGKLRDVVGDYRTDMKDLDKLPREFLK